MGGRNECYDKEKGGREARMIKDKWKKGYKMSGRKEKRRGKIIKE